MPIWESQKRLFSFILKQEQIEVNIRHWWLERYLNEFGVLQKRLFFPFEKMVPSMVEFQNFCLAYIFDFLLLSRAISSINPEIQILIIHLSIISIYSHLCPSSKTCSQCPYFRTSCTILHSLPLSSTTAAYERFLTANSHNAFKIHIIPDLKSGFRL